MVCNIKGKRKINTEKVVIAPGFILLESPSCMQSFPQGQLVFSKICDTVMLLWMKSYPP